MRLDGRSLEPALVMSIPVSSIWVFRLAYQADFLDRKFASISVLPQLSRNFSEWSVFFLLLFPYRTISTSFIGWRTCPAFACFEFFSGPCQVRISWGNCKDSRVRERKREAREKLEGKVDSESLGVKNNGTSQQSRFFSPLIPQRRRNGRSWKFFAFIGRVVKEEQSSGML